MGGFVGDLLGTSKPSTSGQADATQEIRALETRMYDDSIARSKPFYDLGVSGVGQLGQLLGISGDSGAEGYGSLLSTYSPEQLTEDPSYQFILNEGEKAMQRQLAAQGKTMSPEAIKALSEYNQNMASTEYGNAYNRNRASQGDIFDRLAQVANIGTGQSAQMQQAGQSMARNIGEATSAFGQVEDQAKIAQSQGRKSLFDTGVKAAMMFSDERLKEDIKYIREDNGHKIYSFKYKGGDKTFEGVMAQDVLKYNPDAVVEDNGFYKVDYGKLGLEILEVK